MRNIGSLQYQSNPQVRVFIRLLRLDELSVTSFRRYSGRKGQPVLIWRLPRQTKLGSILFSQPGFRGWDCLMPTQELSRVLEQTQHDR